MTKAEKVIQELEEFNKNLAAANELMRKLTPPIAKALARIRDEEILKVLKESEE
jgi:hypothetical protein